MLNNLIDKLSPLICNLIYLDSCGSTNAIASKMLETDCILDGAVVITNNQTKGKGQRNTEWHSEVGANLTFSIVKFPNFLSPMQGFYLNFIASIAVYNALKELQIPKLKVKWPNDIYCDNKKLCGILIESNILGKIISSSVIGIGINVNQKLFRYNAATSVSLISGVDVSKEDLVVEIVKNFNKLYAELQSKDFDSLRTQYLSKLYWLCEPHTFECEDLVFIATIVDIDVTGQLVLKHSGGALQSYNYKQIKFLY